jgi:transaldolase
MADRYGSLGDLSIQAKARGIELSETDIKWADLAIFKRAYFWGLERKHPSKMLMCSMRLGPAQTDGSTASWHIEKIAGSNSVYTCPPKYIAQLMENEDKLKPFDPNAINEQPPKAVIEKLLKIPYFRDSYEIDGLKPDEFGKHAAFIATASEFSAATRGMVDFVAQVKQGYL